MNHDLQSVADLLDGEPLKLNHMYKSMDYETYASICKRLNIVRSSMLKLIKRSPRHLRYALDNPQEETTALRVGKNIHLLFEQSEEFQSRLVHVPEFVGKTLDGKPSSRSKEAKELKQAFLDGLPPDSILANDDEMELYTRVINLLSEKKFATRLLKDSVKEVSIFTTDPETGLLLACRPDFITDRGNVCDLKTTRDASMSFFWNEIFSERGMFYVLQAAFYAHCLKLAGIGRGESFTFIAIEKSPPVDIAIYHLDHGHLDVGDQWRKYLTTLYAECLRTNVWNGYEDRAQSGEVPQFASVPKIWDLE